MDDLALKPKLAYMAENKLVATWNGLNALYPATAKYNVFSSIIYFSRLAISSVDPQVQVNMVSTADSISPSVSATPTKYGFSWSKNGAIYAKIIGGSTTPDEFAVYTAAAGQSGAKISILTDDLAAFTWDAGDNSGGGVAAQFFNISAGTPFRVGPAFLVNKNTSGDQTQIDMARIQNNAFFAVWQSSETGDYDIYGRFVLFYGPTNIKASIPVVINDVRSGNQINPKIAAMSVGDTVRFSVGWEGPNGMYIRVFDASDTGLTFLGPDTQISTLTGGTTGDSRLSISGFSDDTSAVAYSGPSAAISQVFRLIAPPTTPATTTSITTTSTLAPSTHVTSTTEAPTIISSVSPTTHPVASSNGTTATHKSSGGSTSSTALKIWVPIVAIVLLGSGTLAYLVIARRKNRPVQGPLVQRVNDRLQDNDYELVIRDLNKVADDEARGENETEV